MSIIVEDGSGKSDANSYVSIADARVYAEARGVTLPDDSEVETLLIKATDYLLTFECDYVGTRTHDDQSLSFPRKDFVLGGRYPLPDNVIPSQIIAAQCQSLIAQVNGFELLPSYSATDFVTEEKVGPITTKYADPLSVGMRPTLTAVEALLQPLFGSCSKSGAALITVRV